MEKPRILVVDDEASIRHVLHRVLELKGCEIREAGSAEQALEIIADWEPEVALVDIVLPGKSGIQFLSEIKHTYADTEVLVMTSNSSAETALKAIRRGAHDYLQKPFDSLNAVWTNVQRALEKRNLVLKNRTVLREQEERNLELSSTVALPDSDDGLPDIDALQEVLDNFLAAVVHELDVERASLMIANKKTGQLHIAASVGFPADATKVRVPLGEGIAGRVAQTGETFLVTDAAADGRIESQRPGLSNSFISAPVAFSVAIKSERETFGVINVTDRRSGKPFNSDDVAFLSGLAGQLGVVIESAKRSAELHTAYQSLRATQEQLVFSERIKAVGQMAAGVAHDFNNALSVILSRAQFALSRLKTDETDLENVRKDLQTIVKTSLQGAETIRRIQDYTRIRKDTPNSAVKLDQVIRDAVEIARPKWKDEPLIRGRRIEVDLMLGDVPEVSGNVYELTQVVNNLIFNAVEAMPDGGRITLTASSEGETVLMRVRDTGIGMDEETRKRVFEPFFTTKESGQGLGTSVVYGIISRHGGEIEVESRPGDGTVFTIRLPEGKKTTPDIVPPGQDRVCRAVGSVCVLLVDDDDLVRETNVEILESGGHEVVSVAGASEALARYREKNFDLVITDLSMPGMSGLELAAELKKLDLDLPIVLFSGWAIQEQEDKVREAGIDQILVKPCLMEDLLACVQQTARSPAPGRCPESD